MMKRIVAVINKKIEAAKRERKIKRINRSIEIAKDNALDMIEKLEEEKERILDLLAEDGDYESIINSLGNVIGEQEKQRKVIERLDKIVEYLNEEIEVTEE